MQTKESKYKLQLLKLLYKYGALSSVDISKRIDKSLSFTIKVLEELMLADLISTSGFAPSNGGRRALTYQIKEKQFYIIGVGINQFSTYITLFDFANQNNILEQKIDITLEKNQNCLTQISNYIQEFTNKLEIPKSNILGIGVGMPGFIDIQKDINITYGWKHISSYIQKITNIPTFIDNDSSCIALAEKNFGLAKDTSSAMVINMGWGIGLGMIIDGKIYRGDKGFAGEFSHIPLFRNNILCGCGKIGCLETETSLQYIIEKIKEEIHQNRPSILNQTLNKELSKDFEALINAVQQGDLLAVESVSKAAYKIGQGIAILIHILNPKKIILSGYGSAYGDILTPPIQQALNEFCIKKLVEEVDLEISTLGLSAEAIGAANLVIENIEKASNINQIIHINYTLHN